MKITLYPIILCLIVLCVPLNAQNKKGLKPNQKTKATTTAEGVTRVVIVGISDYNDPQIPDLQYAHIDAQEFSKYLKSPSGGSVPEENIKSYYNEEATGGNVHKALYWLVSESKENDKCIIYFSGHGDVETIYEDEPGHLLVYDSPFSIYQINSLRLDDLNRIIRTLTVVKKAQVNIFTDACRAGKLAGSSINGTQATAAALNKQYTNEIKVMSCQANEFSMESINFGGGRGVFSYHLIEGMTGLADINNDQEVSLKEIQRYLEDEVQLTLGNQNQTPITIGDRNTTIAYVDNLELEKLKQNKNLVDDPIAVDNEKSVSPKVLNDDIIAKFYKALEANKLLDNYTEESAESAETIFEQIIGNPEFEGKVPMLKGDFIARLQDDAQQSINNYLSTDHSVLTNRWFGEYSDYKKYADYLDKAANLLDKNHYLYGQIKAKQIYFSVVHQRLKLNRSEAKPEEYAALEETLSKALIYEPRAAYIFNEMGLVHHFQRIHNKAIAEYDKALEISPKWPLPYSNKSNSYNYLEESEKAITQSNKALELKPDFATPNLNLGKAYLALKEYEKAANHFSKYLNTYVDHCRTQNLLGFCYNKLKKYDKALEYYNKTIECDNDYPYPYLNKANILFKEKKYKEAEELISMANKKGLETPNLFNDWGYSLFSQDQFDEAIQKYNMAIGLDENHFYARNNLGILYLSTESYDLAYEQFDYIVNNIKTTNEWVYFDLATTNAAKGDLVQFQNNMLKAIELGSDSTEEIKKEMEESKHLSSIKNSEEYKNIISKL